MALKASVHKAELAISDLDRHVYETVQLTVAKHPSETDQRMMIRLLVFALNAMEHLTFTKGLSTQDEPDIWAKNLSGEIDIWIDLGQPDEKRIRQACGKSKQVIIYNYAGRSDDIWWSQIEGKLARFTNLAIYSIAIEDTASIADLADKNMNLSCTIQDGDAWLSSESISVHAHINQIFPQ